MSLLLKLFFTEMISIVMVALFGLFTVEYTTEKMKTIIMTILSILIIILAITLLLGTWGFI